jgi:hypothetical protein
MSRARYPSSDVINTAEYYAVTLGADEDGKIWTEGQTRWVGFDEENDRIEIRRLSTVNGPIMANAWKQIRQPFIVVNDEESYLAWLAGGGHALIQAAILTNHMPWELEDRRYVQVGMVGWTSAESVAKTAFKHAPTPKVRMSVMKRDRYRCVICGRSPDNHTDVELHVHHVRPFGQRGLTVEQNLLTLCHTCHNGLDPHYSWDLYRFVRDPDGNSRLSKTAEQDRRNYLAAVQRYRKAIRNEAKSLLKSE